MPKQISKAVARQERRSKRVRRDEALVRLVAEEEVTAPRRARTAIVSPLNQAQRAYDAAIRSSNIIFGIGPAGTGKTWFATMRAAEAFKAGEIDKIILTRPAVEAGESLGFLPGELKEKYEPYIRPVQDALVEAFGQSHLECLLGNGRIEARPLAYLRGSTLKNAWVIADEMQNATVTQFKMLLSRIGENAKFIINGDPDQVDLPRGSGLIDAVNRLENIEDISVVRFTEDDIVRSDLCARIIKAYSSTPSSFRYKHDSENESEGLHRFLNDDGVAA